MYIFIKFHLLFEILTSFKLNLLNNNYAILIDEVPHENLICGFIRGFSYHTYINTLINCIHVS